jgi:prophage regulatory protein
MRLIDREGLIDKGIKYTPAHLWRLVKGGRFPKPAQIGQGQGSRNFWSEDEIDDFIRQKLAERNGAAA